MSGYPDDRFPESAPPGPREVYEARLAVRLPGTLLIVTGALSLVAAAIGLIQLPKVPGQMDQAIADVDANPQLTAEQKDMWKGVFTSVKQTAENPMAPVGYVAGIVFGLVVILGGVKLLNLSGVVLPRVGAVLAMIPCTVGLCCLLGLPAGIWALVVLNRPAVRAVIAANRLAPPPNPDDQYMR